MSPQVLVSNYLKKSIRQDAKVAAVILRACPEFITDLRPDETVDEFLRRIGAGTMRREAVIALTESARVNGSWRIADLKPWMRDRLAAELDRFAGQVGQ